MHVPHMKYTYEICNTCIIAITIIIISYHKKVLRTYSFIRGYLFLIYVTSGRSRLAVHKGLPSY